MQKIVLCILLSFSCLIAADDLYISAGCLKRDGNLREYFGVCDRAATLNHAWALNEMGMIFQFGLSDATGLIIIKNIDTAIAYYTAAIVVEPTFTLAKENLERAQEMKREAEQFAREFLAKLEAADLAEEAKAEQGTQAQAAASVASRDYKTPPSSPRGYLAVAESPSGLTTTDNTPGRSNATADSTPVKPEVSSAITSSRPDKLVFTE